MDRLSQQIAEAAENAVVACEALGFGTLDFTAASLATVEATLAQGQEWTGELNPDQLNGCVESFGCYILEVGRRAFGGRYLWHDARDQPVLVVGEPAFRVAMLTWDKVRGRIGGDTGDNIPFFYEGFAGRARRAEPGSDVLHV